MKPIRAIAYGVKPKTVTYLDRDTCARTAIEPLVYWIDETLNYHEGWFEKMPKMVMVKPPADMRIELRGPHDYTVHRTNASK